MVRIKIIAVGKIKEKFYTDACMEFQKRLSAYAKVEICEINEYKCSNSPTAAEIQTVLKKEGDAILSSIPKKAVVIPLCIEGNKLNSIQLSQKIEQFSVQGAGDICFIIGGSFGLSDEVKAVAHLKLSMSDMTFPHMLARVMLLEQIYRSMSILNNGKYHK